MSTWLLVFVLAVDLITAALAALAVLDNEAALLMVLMTEEAGIVFVVIGAVEQGNLAWWTVAVAAAAPWLMFLTLLIASRRADRPAPAAPPDAQCRRCGALLHEDYSRYPRFYQRDVEPGESGYLCPPRLWDGDGRRHIPQPVTEPDTKSAATRPR